MFKYSNKRRRQAQEGQQRQSPPLIQVPARLSPCSPLHSPPSNKRQALACGGAEPNQRQVEARAQASLTIASLPTAIVASFLTFLRPRDVRVSRKVCRAWSQNKGAWDTACIPTNTQVPLTLGVCTLNRVRNLVAHGRRKDQDLLTIATSLPHLQQLDLTRVGVRGSITQAGINRLSCLTQLLTLNMADANLQEVSLDFLLHLTQLRELDLSSCHITHDDVITISAMQQLEVLQLKNCGHFTPMLLAPLENLASLRTLCLNETRVETIPPHKHLTSLDLQGTFVNDDDIESVGQMSSLRSLNLRGNRTITDEGLRHISALSNLERLQMCPCDINTYFRTVDGMMQLARITSLKQLDVSRSYKVNEVVLASFATLPNLTDLNLAWCLSVTNAALCHLSPNLLRLDVTACAITNKGVKNMVLASPKLQRLSMKSCALTDAALVHLATLVDMQHLVLSYSHWLTVDGVTHLESLGKLAVLNVSHCDNVDDAAVRVIACIKSLRTINLNYCTKLTDVGVASLEQLPNLRVLRWVGCGLVSVDVSQRLHRLMYVRKF